MTPAQTEFVAQVRLAGERWGHEPTWVYLHTRLYKQLGLRGTTHAGVLSTTLDGLHIQAHALFDSLLDTGADFWLGTNGFLPSPNYRLADLNPAAYEEPPEPLPDELTARDGAVYHYDQEVGF